MLPQENICFLCLSRSILVHISMPLTCMHTITVRHVRWWSLYIWSLLRSPLFMWQTALFYTSQVIVKVMTGMRLTEQHYH